MKKYALYERLLLPITKGILVGFRMKYAFAAIVLLIACLLAVGCYAQSTSRFQSVGGDYGKNVIETMKNTDSKEAAASNNNNSLWNWGKAPKGSMIKNGKLVADPYYIWKSLNYTNGWLGETEVDPYTGYPIYAYVDLNSGETKYFYVDPNTGKPVYVNRGSTSETPKYGSVSPFYASNDWWSNYSLPPVFNEKYPWT
jgi:hypothetical protein